MQRLEKRFQLAFEAFLVIDALTTNQSRLFSSLIYYFSLHIKSPEEKANNLSSLYPQMNWKMAIQHQSVINSVKNLHKSSNFAVKYQVNHISQAPIMSQSPFLDSDSSRKILFVLQIQNRISLVQIISKTYKAKEMKISYGFVFYFQIFMIILTISLILLYFKPIRTLIFSIADKYKIGQGPIYNTIFWIIFAVIAIILIDSVLTYWAIRQTLEIDAKDMLVDNFDTIKANQHDDYIIIYKKLREYYMAERNFMLTSSTLFVMFVFRNFLSGFRKIYDNETADTKVKAN